MAFSTRRTSSASCAQSQGFHRTQLSELQELHARDVPDLGPRAVLRQVHVEDSEPKGSNYVNNSYKQDLLWGVGYMNRKVVWSIWSLRGKRCFILVVPWRGSCFGLKHWVRPKSSGGLGAT